MRRLLWLLTDQTSPLAMSVIRLLRSDPDGWEVIHSDDETIYKHPGAKTGFRVGVVEGVFSYYPSVVQIASVSVSKASGKIVYRELLLFLARQIDKQSTASILKKLEAELEGEEP